MKNTLNVETIAYAKLTPMRESTSWKIFPATEYRVSFVDDPIGYLMGKKIKLPERVWSDFFSSTYSLQEFEEYNPRQFIKDWKIYDKCIVRVDFVSNSGEERCFKEDHEALVFYDEVIAKISNKVSYGE